MKTSLYAILCIVIRLGAVIWAAGAMLNLPLSLAAASDAPRPERAVAWLLGTVACQLIIAFLFWLYPGVLARLAAGRASREVFESSLPVATLQYVAFSVVGAWFALQGLVYLAYEIVHVFERSYTTQIEWHAIAASSARVVFGVALMLGARGLVTLLERVRNRPQIAASDNETITGDSIQ
ncbi:MAG TPA: hypothetical protein VFL63_03045 [Rhodanobacteraceae bacterium]|nr:hypothetical protein [Rhodanobacteraceae bacterium]